ncbi:MAG: acetylornithine deacetylase, partial [Chitinophagaceae bacterium]|nr:acetylornithine deacetylase [Chitinophagaceae bacterium]
MNSKYELYQQAIFLLQQLITIPSFSKEEDKTADAIQIFLEKADVKTNRYLNNVWATNKFF